MRRLMGLLILSLVAATVFCTTIADQASGFPKQMGDSALSTPAVMKTGISTYIGVGSKDGVFRIVQLEDTTYLDSFVLGSPISQQAAVLNGRFVVPLERGAVAFIAPAGMPLITELPGNMRYSGVCIRGDLIYAASGSTLYRIHEDGSFEAIALFYSDYGAVATPCVGDIDGDGEGEIFVPGYDALYAFEADGSELSGWPQALPASYRFSYGAPVLGDFGRDGSVKCIIAAHEVSGDFWGAIFAYSASGLILTYPLAIPDTGSWIYSTPALADVSSDMNPEVVFTCANGYLCALKSDQTYHNKFTPYEGSLESDVIVADLDGDGKAEYSFLSADTARVVRRGTETTVIDTFDFRSETGFRMGSPVLAKSDSLGSFLCAADTGGHLNAWALAKEPAKGASCWATPHGSPLCDGVYAEPPDTVWSRDMGDSFLVRWTPPVASALELSGYVVYTKDTADTNILARSEVYRGTATRITLPQLADSQTVWVAALYPNQTESKGYNDLMIEGEGISESFPDEVSMTVAYPNPFNKSCRLTIPDRANLLEIYDINGKLIHRDRITGEKSTWLFEANGESGVYFYRWLSDENTISSGKIIYIK